MVTDVCKLYPRNEGTMEKALDQTEKCAAYCGLTNKQTLQLRLLAEELLGMVKSILVEYDAEFWIEVYDFDVTLHVRARADMDISDKDRELLLGVSSTGENESAKGFMGKIRQLFAGGMFGGPAELAAMGSTFYGDIEYGAYMVPNEWSLQRYREIIEAEAKKSEQWDELEKSIVANIADDVIVGVHGNVAEVTIKKNFAK